MTADSSSPEQRLAAAQQMCSEALGHVQAGQSDPALYQMLYDLARVLDGTGPKRCERCNDPIGDHVDPETSCNIWARGADGEVLTVDK